MWVITEIRTISVIFLTVYSFDWSCSRFLSRTQDHTAVVSRNDFTVALPQKQDVTDDCVNLAEKLQLRLLCLLFLIGCYSASVVELIPQQKPFCVELWISNIYDIYNLGSERPLFVAMGKLGSESGSILSTMWPTLALWLALIVVFLQHNYFETILLSLFQRKIELELELWWY